MTVYNFTGLTAGRPDDFVTGVVRVVRTSDKFNRHLLGPIIYPGRYAGFYHVPLWRIVVRWHGLEVIRSRSPAYDYRGAERRQFINQRHVHAAGMAFHIQTGVASCSRFDFTMLSFESFIAGMTA